MKRSLLTWCIVLLLLAAAVIFLLCSKGNRHSNSLSQAQNPSFSASQSSASHSASTNALKAAAASAKTNRFAWRLHNTDKTIGQLVHDPHAILLENAFIDTSKKFDLTIPKNLQSQGDPGAYIVQARGTITPAFKSLLASEGATVISYIPNNAYLVRATEAVASELMADTLVQAVIAYEPYYKVQATLLAMADQPFPQGKQISLALFPDTAQDTIEQIQKLGGVVQSEQNSAAGYPVVTVSPPANWTAVADLPGIHIVEPYYRRHVANDLARPMLGISPDSITQSNYFSLTGSNIMVEVNDSGIDVTHPDFSGSGTLRVFYNNPFEAIDTDGHGTHVAGIIAGDGTESLTVTNASGSVMPGTNGQFRGKAPLASMFAMNFQDDDQTLQQTAATNGALISNNSWNFVGDFDYDLEAASYDAATRDSLPFATGSQPVLYVFSSGNEGSGGIPDTINSPATAKDVMTVGALEELRSITNQVTNADGTVSQPWLSETIDSNAVPGFSSIGNVGVGTEGTFGRYKPDVVAPGTFVVSCRSANWNTSGYYNPIVDNISVFPDFVPTNSVSVAPFNFFVPSNAFNVIFETVTNIGSPPVLPVIPIYLSTNDSPYAFIGTNFVEMAPGVSINENWSVEVSNTTAAPLPYTLIVDVQTTNQSGNYYEVLSNLNQNLGTFAPNGSPYYRYETGTSMAAAAMSGFLALIQDYFTNQFYQPFTPSPALLKALTINGARSSPEYNFQVQNSIGNFQGWGLPALGNSVPLALTNVPLSGNLNVPGPECSTFFRDQSVSNALATGDSETFTVHLNTNDFGNFLPLRVTVAWTDPPGDPSAGLKLVNGLELVVTDLDNPNFVFYGNDIGAGAVFNTPESTTNPPVIDNINNIQNVFIQPFGTNASPDADYSVTILGNRVNVNAVSQHTNNDVQDYAIVISAGDAGSVTDALDVTDGGIVSNPTADQNISIGLTNTILLNQIAGANTPLINTNTVSLNENIWGIGTNNSQFEVGMTNQWHFYIVTNQTTFTNAAFITFGAATLSIPRMGVFANSDQNATVPDPDLDMLVTRGSTDLNAAALTNLSLDEISNCVNGLSGDGASLAAGGTDFVVYTNAQPNEVFYVGVKSESHMAVEYGFVPIFSQNPFGNQDTNGNVVVNGLNVPQPIPDGTPSHPGVARVFMVNINPIQIQNVVVTNVILHQNFGSLVGSITHDNKSVVLNNHDSLSTPPAPGPYTLWYDDSGSGQNPGSRPSDGPGNLQNYTGGSGEGVWIETQEGTTLAQTGEVQNITVGITKHQDLTGSGITAIAEPGAWLYEYVDVPDGITNLQVFGTNLTATAVPPLQMYLLDGAPPNFGDFDFEVLLTNGVPPGNLISDGPPLGPGRYWVGIFNPSPVAQTVYLLAVLNGPTLQNQPQLFSTTNAAPITIDAVTNTSVFVSNTNVISSVNVGMVVQYPRISDLAFTLVSPTGQRILLMENRGGPYATNAGGVFLVTNSIGSVSASGSFEPNTNFVNVGANQGSLTVTYNMFTIPDQMTIYYGTNAATFNAGSGDLLFDSGMVSGSSNVTVNFGPGASTYLTIIMNQFGNTNVGGSDAWTYDINGTIPVFNYLTFTEDTNLTTVPIKFAAPPFDLRDEGTNYTLSDLNLATNGDYFGQTNIYDAFGGWLVPSNQLTGVISNSIVVTNINYNQVSVISDPAVAFSGSNYLALGYGTILRTNLVTPSRMVTFSYAYRGPGIAGWWRGEGDARDSSDAESKGQNGALIGRFNFPAGEVSQTFEMENSGGAYDFAGTNAYVQIRQQPSYSEVSTNAGSDSTGVITVQSSYLDVGTGPGMTVEGWINPTNVSWQEPLVEWLARVPTNGSDTNLSIIAGPFLNRQTDHYYYLLAATNWTTSETWAEQIGGHLATVRTADEENWIFDTFGDYQGRNRNLWIGLTNFEQGAYGYVDGLTNISYTNWMYLQPTNCDGTRNYTLIFSPTNYLYTPTNSYPGLWALADNDGFVCSDPTVTNIVYGVVEVTNLQPTGVQFWISVTNVPGTTNLIMTNTGCLFANFVDSTNGSHWIYSGPNLVQSNVFQHVALTYDTNSGIANLFYNGTNVASTNFGVVITPKTTGDVLLGKDMNLETNNYYGGDMDEMSIYSRALSDTEIQAIYHVSAYATNRLVGKFNPAITPPESLAEAQVVLGNMTNTILGANNTWQEGSFSFTTASNSLPMQIMGIEPGILLDDFTFSEAPLGNLYYQPEQSLDDLQGENANGVWTLEIWDTRNNTLATNVAVLSWQMQMVLLTNALPPVTVGDQEPTTVTIPPGQTIALAVNAPIWATIATNTLVTSTLPLDVYFNQNTPASGVTPPDTLLFGPVTQGSATLFAPPVAPPPPNFIPGRTYYIGLQNPNTTEATATFEVDFNLVGLTNDVPYNDTVTNGAFRYFSFEVSTNDPYEATFQLLRLTGNADLVVSKVRPLPTLTDSDYGSFNSGRAAENIYVLTNSGPVPLTPGTWYLGVFNRGTTPVNYSVLAQELDLPPLSSTNNVTYIPLTNGVPFDYTEGPGAALTNFFSFFVTNTVTILNGVPATNVPGSIHFELYNMTGNGNLTVQSNAAPFAPPFFQSSQQPGLLPEFIQIQTNSVLTNLTATWYLGVPNQTTNLIHFTILATIDTNNLFPAFPGAEGAGAGTAAASFRNGFGTNNTVYHVVNLNDSGPGSLRDAVSSTNRTIVFDISGNIYLQSPLVVTNSYLTIAGQTAPEGGITVAGASTIISTNVHDVIVRYIRFRPTYSGQNLFVSANISSGIIYQVTPRGVSSTFASSGLNYPYGMAFDGSNNLFVANNINDAGSGGYVTEIATNGTQTTIPSGPDPKGLAFDNAGNLFETDYHSGNIYKYPPGGPLSLFATVNPAPQAIAINSSGDLFVGTGFGNGNEAITEIAPNGKQSTFATGLGYIGGLAFDGAGNLFEADSGSGNIYKFTPVGVRSTFASGLGNIGELGFNDAGDLFETDSGAGTVNQFTPSGIESTFTTGLNGPVGLVMQPMSMLGLTTGLGGDGLQFNTVSNVIADHISAMWSSNSDLSVLNSTNVTVQWSVISDTFAGTNLPASNGALVRYGSGPVSLHHDLFADNYTGSPHLGDNVTLDFVNNVVYNWVTNAGYATNDGASDPNGYTNYLNYICNYLIAGPNTFSTNIAFWSYTTNTWIFQTNNLIDGDKVGFLNGANIQWNMFTNSPGYLGLNTQTNQFLLPPVSVDEAYLAYEKVLDFAGASMFRREPAETNIVENVRRQAGSIVGAPGLLPTNTSTLIYVNTSQDGIPDFWKITFGQVVTNSYNNFALDNSGYSELEEFDNWLAGPHALTITNQPIGVNLQKLFGKTGNLSFFLTNSIHGFAYLTNVLDTYTNTGPYSNSIAMFYPTNVAGSGTNYSGYASFDVYVTNTDTVANFGPVTVNVFVSAVGTFSSQIVGTLLPDPVTNNIGPFTIQWYQIFVPTNAVAATNTLLFAGSPMNVWYDTNYPPLVLSPGSAQLLTGVTNGVSIVYTNNVPSLIQGGIYYLGIQNTNNISTTYAVGLDFDLIGATPLTGGSPVTNTVPPNTAQYYSVTVPSHAIAATNILLYATGGSVDLWFNQTVLPTFGGPGDTELLAGFTGTTPGIGSPILTLASSPPLVPGSTYYLAVNNTGGSSVDYAIEVDFLLYYTPPILPDVTNLFAVAGTTFTLDDTATDTNAGALFYSLTTLPPVGATINNTNGIITWNVPTNQPAGNILFTTIVTNSFTDQSATNSFTVTVIPEGGGTGPQTNTVPTNSINWIVVNVPTNAVWATNILLYATNFPVNVLFTTNFPPSTNGAYTLMFDETNGISVLGLNTYPTNIIPGGTYYLGVQNTNNVAVNYAIEVDFALNVLYGPPFSQTLPATHVTGTNAELNGFATPGATFATAWFEWGPSTNYIFSNAPFTISGGNSVLFVTNFINGLLPKQVYHYRLDVSNALGVAYGPDQLFGVGGVSVWGENLGGVTNLPISLTNEVAVQAEVQNGVALNNQGQVTVWGDDTFGQNEVPTNLTDVSSIAAGNGSYALALQDGIITGWGDDSSGQINVPAGLSNVVEMAAGEFHGLALQNDGIVVAWGANGYGQTTVPVGLSNVVSIAAGSVNSLALLNNGTVVAWGGGKSNTGTFPNYGQSIVPAGLTNIVAIAAYGYTSTALKSDGTVVAWGENNFNQTNVPAGLNSVVAIANGLYHSLALKENGLAKGWGNNVYGEATVPAGLTNIYAICGGNYFSMALESPLSINLNITPITDGVPQTNTIAANSVIYYIVPVPANAIAATNLLSFDTAPLNIWFNQTNLPQPANPPDFLLLGGVFGGTSNILTASSTPPLVPGSPYYLAIQNTNSMAVSYVFGVNFDLVQLPPNTNATFDVTIIHTNIGGTNGFLLEWYAPTNDSFQVQETDSLQPVSWNTFSNIVTYTGPLTVTNGLFTFFDNGSEYPFQSMRYYQVLLLSQTNNNSIPPGGITWLPINVPTNAIWATNILSSATGPLNVWFTTNAVQTTNSGAAVLMSGLVNGVSILGTNTTPTNIVPGGTYYIGLANTGASAVTYNFAVNFDLVQPPPPAIPPFNSITYTNIGGTNGFLLTWYAPTDEVFQVQETDSLQPVSWNTFSNIVTYTGPLTATNGLFTFFDNGSEYPFSTFRYYQIVLLSQTNTIPTGTVRWLTVNVPTNAIWATNILSSASAPLNVWFTTNSAQTTNSNSSVLMFNTTSGVSILGTNTTPTNIVPGGTYYIGLANTGASAATYNFTVNFDLVQPPPAVIPPFNRITYTNNGFLLTWYAPTAEVFQVQETSSLQPVLWNTFSNIITYTGPPVTTNGLFTFFDNGSQYPFGAIRIYQLLLSSGSSESLVLPALSNYQANNSQAMAVTNKAADSNPSATLNYSLAVFPAATPSPTIGSSTAIINWTPAASEAGSEFKFTTVVTNNSSPILKATNAFTVFVMPAPSITNALVTSTNTTLSWVAPTNDLFQVEWTTNLIPLQVWSTFPPTITSTTGSFSFTDTNKPVAMKFYRLIWLPLP